MDAAAQEDSFVVFHPSPLAPLWGAPSEQAAPQLWLLRAAQAYRAARCQAGMGNLQSTHGTQRPSLPGSVPLLRWLHWPRRVPWLGFGLVLPTCEVVRPELCRLVLWMCQIAL